MKNNPKSDIMLKFVKNDTWLSPYVDTIEDRHENTSKKLNDLTQNKKQSLSDFASGHLFFGLHKQSDSWAMREWAPNASEIYLIGTFNDWKKDEKYKLKPIGNGNWELILPSKALRHGDLYKLLICWDSECHERIPAWARRVVQDPNTHIFSAEVWNPEKPYTFKAKKFKPNTDPLLIYECHVGMAVEEERVGTYEEFRLNILPRIKQAGYNAIQLMAVQEHPYYGSFGYHVSSFFAASSRYGTPDDLKRLIDDAHTMGIAVIMDLVHSHSVKNELEGLGRFDGTYDQYFHSGNRREHKQWDSLCFDYGKNEVLHFLLSNCRFWIEEYKFDGFRFDGVTSMIYYSHGLGETFVNYDDYYSGDEDIDAITYLTLANILTHEVNRHAITIAEEVSGMPGLAVSFEDGGYGFDYRLAMNIPDYWIKTIKEQRDEDWKLSSIFWELTNRRSDEKTISYVESHDQAMVGDKTVIFRLIDSDMYTNMSKLDDPSHRVDRGIELHKMIRLITASTINGGYLNFMGNEFGHPEWIDFPREGNEWSYKYARRQWSLVDDQNLKYHYLSDFDKAMLTVIKSVEKFEQTPIVPLWENDDDQLIAYMRDDLVFVFNFHPDKSYVDYGFLAPNGKYEIVLDTSSSLYGGNDFVDQSVPHFTQLDPLYEEHSKGWLKLYIPARTGLILRKTD